MWLLDLSYESLYHAVLYSCLVEILFVVSDDIMESSDIIIMAPTLLPELFWWQNALMGTHCAVQELTNLCLSAQRTSIFPITAFLYGLDLTISFTETFFNGWHDARTKLLDTAAYYL